MADEAEDVKTEEADETMPEDVTGDQEQEETPEASEDKPAPGTPDKALQKVQQEIGNLSRQLADLSAKKAATGELSDADKAKLAKAQERLERVRELSGDPIADHLLDLTEKVSKADAIEAELKETKARLAALENDRGWERARQKYTGLDVDAIWDKANADAAETLGDDATPKQITRLASKWFEERCDAAKKRQGDAPPKKKDESAPSTYRVGGASRTAPVLSEEDEMLAIARSLVREI